jgi:hypothetical protein
MKRYTHKSVRLALEQLEDRLTPGLLIVTPSSGFIDPLSGLVRDAAQAGLTTAQAQTHGVITWSPGAQR